MPARTQPARADGKPRRQPGRHIVVTVSRDEWDRLAASAAADERDPFQQARWLLIRALKERAAHEQAVTEEVAS